MKNILERTINEHADALERGEYSSFELTSAFLERITAKDTNIGAYITVCQDEALDAAKSSDKRRAEGKCLGALDGIPFALKDNICTKGIKTTCASMMLRDYIPPYNAHVYDRLLLEGAVLLGKLNMDEFAMGSSTESSVFGITKNPIDTSRVPGGSSGGSAAAVGAKEAVFTLGSDTGGSIRQPAAFCGVVGIKPTYGRVSRSGLVALASSFDQIGPLTRTVRDNAIVLSAISGIDAKDSTTKDFGRERFEDALGVGVDKIKVGFDYSLTENLSDNIKNALLTSLEALKAMGAKIVEATLPDVEEMLAVYHILCCAEASSNLARFDGVRYGHRAEGFDSTEELWVKSRSEGFGDSVKRRILLGTFSLSHGFGDEYYKNALTARKRVSYKFGKLFENFDVLLLPVTPSTAHSLGDRQSPLEASTSDIFCVGANLSGLPAISIPAGLDKNGLPIGVQLMASTASEALLYRVSGALEEVL